MPEPVGRSGQRYMPGLDGLRAVAVLAVIAYHLDLGWAPGGLLGVGIFFTLSGYLITDILMEGWSRRRLKLGEFWLRRARRLLPALFVMLVVITAWVTIADPSELSSLRGMVGSSAVYVSNWWLIAQDISYFARFGPPSPLGHLWSLAVEEQFYIFWPWILLLGLRLIPERGHPFGEKVRARIRPRLAVATLLLAAASAIAMALLYHPGFDTTRVYDGTDTRAFGLLIGAAVAMVWPSRHLSADISPRARRLLDWAGVGGLLVIALLIWRTNQYSSFIYEGGLVILSVATAVVVAVLAHPAARLGPVLGWGPLRWIGVRSYGIYLWHLPIIVLTTPPLAGVEPLRAALQVGASVGLAALSWHFVEEPVRQGALGRLWGRVRASRIRRETVSRRGWAALSIGGAVFLLALAGMVGLAPKGPLAPLAVTTDVTTAEVVPAPAPMKRRVRQIREPSGDSSAQTSCRSVVHIGDSTSEGLISDDYLPDRRQQIGPQYARVGAKRQRMEISGATSIVETLAGGINAQQVARSLKQNGYDGCWVIALGTNDTADVYVGSNVGLSERIDRMMSVIGDDPVLWVNVKSLLSSGPYSESDMQDWNQALLDACPRYPNMHVYDWASRVKDAWFIDDGIHFTSPGYAARARMIADALAKAFPARRPFGGWIGVPCVVS